MSKLTLRTAFDTLYHVDELAASTRTKFDAHLSTWERLTDDPPVDAIDNATVAAFRQAMVDEGLSPFTIKGVWGSLRTILRRLGPVTEGNPWALGLIDRVPAMRPVKTSRPRPYRVPLQDITATYVAAKAAEFPRVGPLPADWWRALIVVSYTTALRRGDLFALTWKQIDFRAGTVDFTARRTGKADVWPLHPVAITHLERIRRKGGRVFAGAISGGYMYRRLRSLQRSGGVDRMFGFHDLRRTAASEIERVRAGLGAEFLQHAPRDVSDVSYLNRFDELREALDEMRLPVGFKSGPKMAERDAERQRHERLQPADFAPRITPSADDWTFQPGGFKFRGKQYRMSRSSRLRLLELLATSETPVTIAQAAAAIGSPKGGTSTRRVHVAVSGLRKRLRELFGLPESIDPVPCIERGQGGAWTLWLPPEIGKK